MRLALLSAFVLAACGSKPDVRPIEQSLATALPVAYVATVATAALAGQPARCATALGPVVSIDVSADCPLPMISGAEGTITVSRVGSAAGGILAAIFTSVDVGARKLVIKSVDLITVTSRDTMLELSYVDQDVKLTSPDGAEVKQSSWVITVDPGVTPGDTSDDNVSLVGVRQTVLGGITTQTALTQVQMSAGCRRNPIAGSGTIETANGNGVFDSTGATNVSFHATCDGRANVNVSLTSAIGSSGGTVALDLLDQPAR